jgi:hypothetical protein
MHTSDILDWIACKSARLVDCVLAAVLLQLQQDPAQGLCTSTDSDKHPGRDWTTDTATFSASRSIGTAALGKTAAVANAVSLTSQAGRSTRRQPAAVASVAQAGCSALLLEKQQEQQMAPGCVDSTVAVAVSVLHLMPCFVHLVLQFAIGSVLSLIFWATGFVKPPKLDARLVSSSKHLHTLANHADRSLQISQ